MLSSIHTKDKLARYGIIFAAGYGKRLRPLTEVTPKPLISIDGEPLIKTPIRTFQTLNFDGVVLNTHYLADQLHDFASKDPFVYVAHETELLGQGGGLINMMNIYPSHFPKDKAILTMNADMWFDEANQLLVHTIKEMAQFWDPNNMDILLMLVPVNKVVGAKSKDYDYHINIPSLEPGRIIRKDTDLIASNEPSLKTVYAGVQILNPNFYSAYQQNNNLGPSFQMLPVFDKAQKEGRLYGMVHNYFWNDVGTLEDYRILQNRAF